MKLSLLQADPLFFGTFLNPLVSHCIQGLARKSEIPKTAVLWISRNQNFDLHSKFNVPKGDPISCKSLSKYAHLFLPILLIILISSSSISSIIPSEDNAH